jgi:hypothetical protein
MSSLTSLTQAYFLDSNEKNIFEKVNIEENSYINFIQEYFPKYLRQLILKKNITIFIFVKEKKLFTLNNFYPMTLVKTFFNYHNLTFKNNRLNNCKVLISDLLFSDGIVHIFE